MLRKKTSPLHQKTSQKKHKKNWFMILMRTQHGTVHWDIHAWSYELAAPGSSHQDSFEVSILTVYTDIFVESFPRKKSLSDSILNVCLDPSVHASLRTSPAREIRSRLSFSMYAAMRGVRERASDHAATKGPFNMEKSSAQASSMVKCIEWSMQNSVFCGRS